MKKIINKFFLTGDKLMAELHLKQAGLSKHCEKKKNLEKQLI